MNNEAKHASLAAQSYHHGDLRNKLIQISTEMIREAGVGALSLRKLAEKAGVSRTAPYHHFKDKNDLLASVAEEGFVTLTAFLQRSVPDKARDAVNSIDDITSDRTLLKRRLAQTVDNYIEFAVENRTQYELMFGSELWRKSPSERLQRTAKDCFRQYANLIADFHLAGLLKADEEPLRLAQVMWSTLHGLVKLSHDGIFVRQDDLSEISQYALSKLIQMIES
jgi:AcrR family transcriptional regulator